MALITLLISLYTQPMPPKALIETPIAEIEAYYVPPGHQGPIVAAPFSTRTF